MLIETYKTCKNCDYFVQVCGAPTLCLANRILIEIEEDDPRSCYHWIWDRKHNQNGDECDDLCDYAKMVRAVKETTEEDDQGE